MEDDSKKRPAQASTKAATADPASMMKRISPDRVDQFVLRGPQDDLGPPVEAVVAKGHCIHIPTGVRRTVGSVAQAVQNPLSPPTFTTVTSSQCRVAMAGETVMLPEQEVERLRAAGWLLPADGVPRAAATLVSAAPGPAR